MAEMQSTFFSATCWAICWHFTASICAFSASQKVELPDPNRWEYLAVVSLLFALHGLPILVYQIIT
jgi:hypothetical protein